ncbi:hypothetical protein EYZ11_010800 [Aspergillus tanneri]|uniref:FAD dependent oxidoreductase domain-containing protein n=1 Tax=Aspergillus tanneri TaxID=1220188 RepID=A0A4S3J6K1_9EURO|nr:hypothetical protein EYZ11_010800 [Aspergillus tanneri]
MDHRELKSSEADARGIMFATCSRAALSGWRTDPIFQPYFHETGSIVSGDTPDLIRHIKETEIDSSEGTVVELKTAEDFRNTMPAVVLTGDFPGWKGWLSKTGAGWVHAKKAILSVFTEAKRLGVTFITGSAAGDVISLVYEGGDVVATRTADGIVHRAEHTILSAGAGSDRLLDFKMQLRFFMEPDEDQHELKICDEHPGYCNLVSDHQCAGGIRSVPFAKQQIPLEAEARARNFLRDTMPHLASGPMVFARICWDADTPDRAFLIDRHPEHPSLLVAVGDLEMGPCRCRQ